MSNALLLLNILSLILIGTLTALQFNKEKRFIKTVVIALSIAIFGIGLLNLMVTNSELNELKERFFRSISKIYWEQTELEMAFPYEENGIKNGNSHITLKIFPVASKYFKNDPDVKQAIQSLEISNIGLRYIPEELAKKIWFSLAKENGDIDFKDENEKGVERFMFNQVSNSNDKFWKLKINFGLAYKTNIKSRYTSLYDLNDKLIIARVYVDNAPPIYSIKTAMYLKTDQGNLFLDLTPTKGSARGDFYYVGILIKEDNIKF